MAQIHVLDSDTIDKIAAGEVVERPSSVVKELVENAIDAKATAVTVEIKDGGIEFIRVTDNGAGMEKGQIRKAFLRHATSKIETADDLTKIVSLGFRGEALSSIAAVSKVEMITKTADSITGTRILLEGGNEVSFDEIGAPDGTTFIMRNLFFNTPVRRKFLKQPATEGSYIADLMEHLALSRPDISFKLIQGNQMKFHTSGNGDLREVIYRIYGKDTANALVPIAEEQDGIRIEGYLGQPIQVRSNRNQEICFINGRFIRSNIIFRAVEEGYKEYLMQHKFPFCVLHISMDTQKVDVNVHPNKMDVRFTQAQGFSIFCSNAVRKTLRRNEMIPEALLGSVKEHQAEQKQEKKLREQERKPEPFEKNRTNSYRVMEEESYEPTRKELAETFAQSPAWMRVKESDEKEETVNKFPQSQLTEKVKRIANETANETVNETVNETADEDDDFFTETTEIKSDIPDDRIPSTSQSQKIPGYQIPPASQAQKIPDDQIPPASQEGEKPQRQPEKTEIGCKTSEISDATKQSICHPEQLSLFEEKILSQESRKRFRIIGQVFETYWLIEFDNKLLMIDQHAAHEKVNYERLMKQFREKSVVSQTLLPPVIVSLSAREQDVLLSNLDVFESLGFETEEFGGNEYALRSVPTDLYGCDEKRMFLEVLDQLAEGGSFGGIRVIEEKIASMSCKAAVKGNQLLSMQEAEALIDELLTLDNPYNCPHGRPTVISMTKAEMEKKFKRIV